MAIAKASVDALNLAAIILISLHLVFAIGLFTWTHANFLAEDVPAYDAAINGGFVSSGSTQMDRYGVRWFVVHLGVLRIFGPIVALWSIVEAYRGTNVLAIYTLTMSILIVLDVLKFALATVVFFRCKHELICVNEDPDEAGNNKASTPFFFAYFLSFTFIVLWGIYLAVKDMIGKLALEKKQSRLIRAARRQKV